MPINGKGAKTLQSAHDTRLPITFPILTKLVDSVEHVCVTEWTKRLFCSMFLLAFFGDSLKQDPRPQDPRPQLYKYVLVATSAILVLRCYQGAYTTSLVLSRRLITLDGPLPGFQPADVVYRKRSVKERATCCLSCTWLH